MPSAININSLKEKEKDSSIVQNTTVNCTNIQEKDKIIFVLPEPKIGYNNPSLLTNPIN